MGRWAIRYAGTKRSGDVWANSRHRERGRGGRQHPDRAARPPDAHIDLPHSQASRSRRCTQANPGGDALGVSMVPATRWAG
jgi:hypothetical protein